MTIDPLTDSWRHNTAHTAWNAVKRHICYSMLGTAVVTASTIETVVLAVHEHPMFALGQIAITILAGKETLSQIRTVKNSLLHFSKSSLG